MKNMSRRNFALLLITINVFVAGCFGLMAGVFTSVVIKDAKNGLGEILQNDVRVINEESAVIDVSKNASDSVVSIVITQDVPLYEDYNFEDLFLNRRRRQIGTEERQVGAGTGFVVTEDGLIVTNRHVVDQEDVSYTVIFNNDTRLEAEVLAKDTLFDLAFIKVKSSEKLKVLELSDSENLKVGQTVIAIGNALGEFSNSVSLGIVSGLGRNIVAGNGQNAERLTDVIQTDASINLGNSGGPLLDIEGRVVGVNVAVAGDAENIGFAIPVNYVKDLLKRLNDTGNIERPLLGVRYTMVDEDIKESKRLDYDYGALLISESVRESAVQKDSPADKAGLRDGDIILEVDGTKVDSENPLFDLVQKKSKGDKVILKVARGDNEFEVEVKL